MRVVHSLVALWLVTRAGCHHRGMSITADENRNRIRVATAEDVLGIIPYLLGFVPHDSLVAMVVDHARLEVTLRVDLADVESDLLARGRAPGSGTGRFNRLPGSDALDDLLARWLARPECDVILVCYADDPTRAQQGVDLAIPAVGPDRVLMALAATSERYWTRGFETGAVVRAEGWEYRLDSSRTAAQAVFLGLHAHPSRSALAKVVAGPRGKTMGSVRTMITAAELRLAGLGADEALFELGDLLAGAGGEITGHQAVQLGTMVAVPRLRGAAVAAMRQDNANDMVDLWTQVCRMMPPERQSDALCLAGLAAWLSGQGTLSAISVEQASPGYCSPGLLAFLRQARDLGLPPQIWPGVVADVRRLAERDVPALSLGSEREEGTDEIGQTHSQGADEHIADHGAKRIGPTQSGAGESGQGPGDLHSDQGGDHPVLRPGQHHEEQGDQGTQGEGDH